MNRNMLPGIAGAALLGVGGWIGWQHWQAAHTPASASPSRYGAAAPAREAGDFHLPPVAAPSSLIRNPACRLPLLVQPGEEPLQTEPPADLRPFVIPRGRAVPLAGFSVDARVLSTKAYPPGTDHEAIYVPTDLALGWGPMADPAVLGELDITQSGRWYHYGWLGQSPIEPRLIVHNSANMHMLPSDPRLAEALARVRKDDRVRVDGWLVQVEDGRGWHWRSSLTRDDEGAGACEIIYVCDLAVY